MLPASSWAGVHRLTEAFSSFRAPHKKSRSFPPFLPPVYPLFSFPAGSRRRLRMCSLGTQPFLVRTVSPHYLTTIPRWRHTSSPVWPLGQRLSCLRYRALLSPHRSGQRDTAPKGRKSPLCIFGLPVSSRLGDRCGIAVTADRVTRRIGSHRVGKSRRAGLGASVRNLLKWFRELSIHLKTMKCATSFIALLPFSADSDWSWLRGPK